MKEKTALENLVNSLLKLPEKSKAFADKINSKGLVSVTEDESYAIGMPLKMPYFTKRLDDSVISLEPEVPKYAINDEYYQEIEQMSGEKKLAALKDFYTNLYELNVKTLDALAYLQSLHEPSDLSMREYSSLFENAVDSFKNFADFYNELKEKEIIVGDEPKLKVKLFLDDLIQGVVEYNEALESVLSSVSKIEDSNKSKEYNPKKIVKPYDKIKNYIQGIVENYEFLKESGFVELLKDGVNLLEPQNKKLSKAFANVMYAVSKYEA